MTNDKRYVLLASDEPKPMGDTLFEYARPLFARLPQDHTFAELRATIYDWLTTNAKDERKPTDSDEQFYYKTRKKALGPFKRQLWDLPAEAKATLARAYDEKFAFLFNQLAIVDTADIVAKFVSPPVIHRLDPSEAVAVAAAPDDADLSD